MFKNKLELKDDLDELILLAFEKIKEFIVKNSGTDSLASVRITNEQLTAQYQAKVLEFYNTIKLHPVDYRLMMSETGGLSERKKQVRDLYEDAIQKYWNRQWDDALAGFNKCIELIPDDAPSLCLIDRIKIMKDNPPADNWQGEFIQTKK